MNNIGILTFHNASNYGAALQAYATVKACEKLGFDAEIIDYTNDYRRAKYSAISRILQSAKNKNLIGCIKNIIGTPGIILRNYRFSLFYKKNLKISATSYSTPQQLRSSVNIYNTFISGSDQIWSYKNNGSDYSYMLDFVPTNVNKVSYASSFGMSEIDQDLAIEYSRVLSRYDALSTRENVGKNLIESLSGRKAFLALDPVLLHSKDFWISLLSKPKFIPRNKYSLIYLNDNRHRSADCIKNFKQFTSSTELVNIGSFKLSDIFSRGVKLMNYTDPFEFLYLINNAQVVYTTSFHAIVFCMIFNVPFYAFLSGDKGRDSRVLQILERFSLLDRAILNDQKNKVFIGIDFTTFNKEWPSYRDECLDFLGKSIIQGCVNNEP